MGAWAQSDAASVAVRKSLATPLVGSWAGRRARRHAPFYPAGASDGQHFQQAKPEKPAFPAFALQSRRGGAKISTRSGITLALHRDSLANPSCPLQLRKEMRQRVSARAHDNTAPSKLMTTAELVQAVSRAREEAEIRLQEIRDEIALLEAEAEDLNEVING